MLEDIISETVDRTAEEEATKDVMKKLELEEEDRRRRFGSKTPQEQQEEEIKGLVQDFLFPMVKKELVMKRVRENQKKYLNSVLESVFPTKEG